MIFRRVETGSERTRRKVSPSVLVSIGVHLVVAVALMRMLILHIDVSSSRKPTTPEERVGFVRLAKPGEQPNPGKVGGDRSEETRLNSSHVEISYAVFCLKKKKKKKTRHNKRQNIRS